MPVAIPNAVPGAYIEECYDDKGDMLKVRRKGWITRVEYPKGNAYDPTSIKKVFAFFDKEKGEEETKLFKINLIRVADRAALERIKTNRRNEEGDALKAALDISTSPAKDKRGAISQDKTGIDHKKGMTPTQAERLRSE